MTLDGKNEMTRLDAKVPMCSSTTTCLKVHIFLSEIHYMAFFQVASVTKC